MSLVPSLLADAQAALAHVLVPAVLEVEYVGQDEERLLQALNRQCAACGTKKRVHLRHCDYSDLGHEPDLDLVPLCGPAGPV
jgi:hypothetical protein